MNSAQRVILQFPRPLLTRTDDVAVQLNMNRSNLIRSAVEEKLDRIERERLANELREGYLELAERRAADNADLDLLTTELLALES